MTPGVHLSASSDAGDQRYVSPSVAIHERGADMVIVGRGVTRHGDNDQVILASDWLIQRLILCSDWLTRCSGQC